MQHNSLLILTWDEDNYREGNRIVTLLAGPMVKAGSSDQRINHYNVLRTMLGFYGLPPLGASRDAEDHQEYLGETLARPDGYRYAPPIRQPTI